MLCDKLLLRLLCCHLARGLWIHPEVYISINKRISVLIWARIILEMCVCSVGFTAGYVVKLFTCRVFIINTVCYTRSYSNNYTNTHRTH